MTTGDIVRLTPEQMNRLRLAVDDVCGEVVSVGKLTARVQWDDGRETSVLLKYLEPADKKPMATTYSAAYTDALQAERAALLTVAHDELKQAWSKL